MSALSRPAPVRPRFRRLLRAVAALPLLVVLTMGAAACSSPSIELTSGTVVIDVRTPAEFAEGHLEGAVNIDLQSPDFAARIADLDPDGDYVVYCRSGNRSAQARTAMTAAGIASVVDTGSLSAASGATGLPIVR